MITIYIQGASGLGKTSFPKDYAQKTNKAIYITSSNLNDLLSGYKQESIIVWDEVEKSIEFLKALKLLDNHTCSLFSSRFRDKPMACVEMLFITSTFKMYKIFDYGKEFEQKQIRRRIPFLLEVKNKEEIFVKKYDENTNKYVFVKKIKNPLNDYLKTKPLNSNKTKEFEEYLNKEYKI